jgi:hypothetical protein
MVCIEGRATSECESQNDPPSDKFIIQNFFLILRLNLGTRVLNNLLAVDRLPFKD